MDSLHTLLKKQIAQAAGGRVVKTNFIALDTLDRRILAVEGLKHLISGGFASPTRAVITLFPEHIPNVSDPVTVLELVGDFPAAWNETDLMVGLKNAGLEPDLLGDLRFHHGRYQIATTGKAKDMLLALERLGTLEVSVEEADLSGEKSRIKTREAVVPSMRIDVVGARGFGVSRAYFQSGIENGKVRLNGQIARSSADIKQGDTLSAEGLGQIEFKRVINETRRGNYKVELEVRK